MGWFKSIVKPFKSILRPIQNMIDPLLPESVKKFAQKGYLGIAGEALTLAPGESRYGDKPDTSIPAASSLGVGAMSDDELTAEAQKRLARLGKYFTSPLGVLQNASTASQRVFS